MMVIAKISYVMKFVSPTLFRLSMTLLSIAFMAKYSPVPSNSTKWTLRFKNNAHFYCLKL